MTQPDETVIDHGRRRREPQGSGEPPPTEIDEDRERESSPPEWLSSLPPHLADRYDLKETLSRTGGQADIYLARARETGTDHVIKRYRTARTPHPQVVEYLRRHSNPHVVRVLETGAQEEIMEHLPGGNLLELRQSRPDGLDPPTLHTIVRQLAAALTDMHRNKIVHLDIKPVNILLRSRDPFDAVVIDFGISMPLQRDGEQVRTQSATLQYAPPEWVADEIGSAATDWWALGMTIVELANGRHPLAGLPASKIRTHIGTRSITVAGIGDQRLRMLCQGLLRRDPKDRWAEKEVGEWLVGKNPATGQDPVEDNLPGAAHSFEFNGRRFHRRDELALALATNWEYAASQLCGDDRTRLGALRHWLDQFQDEQGAAARSKVESVTGSRAPGNVRLVHVIRALDPTQAPFYRHELITPDRLPELAHRGLKSEPAALFVLSDLWRHKLLHLLATARPTDASPGGTGLLDQDRLWREERARWLHAASRVVDDGARAELEAQMRTSFAHAVWLHAATGGQQGHADALLTVQRAARALPAPVAWFTALVNRPDSVWVAFVLAGRARNEAQAIVEQLQAAAEERAALLLGEAVRDWSRRQNRPLAAAWAVAGVAPLAALYIALLTLGDAVNWVSDSTSQIALIVAAATVGVSLTLESLLAVDIGGRFHPRYSIPGAGGMVLGRIGARAAGNGVAATLVLLALLAGLGAVTALSPLAIPLAATTGHAIWVFIRHRMWTVRMAEEDSQIEQARRERLQQA